MKPTESVTSKSDHSQDAVADRWTWVQRHGLFLVAVSPIAANIVGSIFNVWYNTTQSAPLLTDTQMQRFEDCIKWFNLVVYPIAIGCFLLPLAQLRRVHRALINEQSVDAGVLAFSRRRVVNLPWWFLIVVAAGWLICIPVFPLVLSLTDDPLATEAVVHLITSFLIASLIAVTQSFFAVELCTQAALFPVFFRDSNPASVPGGVPLNIPARGILWAFAAVVCPVVSLVLIMFVPHEADDAPRFGLYVACIGISFGLTTSWMIGRWITTPLRQLQHAASEVAEGNYFTRVHLLRSDEFGLLIERFNQMVEGLQNREKLQETFGRHVGREAARQIMSFDSDLQGKEQTITVMFVDVRNFTKQSSALQPANVVAGLNHFFGDAVEAVEAEGGMVNKFLGDGFMAIFGIGTESENHAEAAVRAGLNLIAMIEKSETGMKRSGWKELRIGVGIHTGAAVVGCIGSPKRQEYTAIGDTVNVASRIESLTKAVGEDLILSETTRALLDDRFETSELPEQMVKGKLKPIRIFAATFQSN